MMSYSELLLKNNQMGSLIDIINNLSQFEGNLNGLSTIKSELINEKKEKVTIAQQNKKVTKKDIMVNEMCEITGKLNLKTFLSIEMVFENYKEMIEQLATIDITTYNQLEKAIVSKKFIKMCRSNGKKNIKR